MTVPPQNSHRRWDQTCSLRYRPGECLDPVRTEARPVIGTVHHDRRLEVPQRHDVLPGLVVDRDVDDLVLDALLRSEEHTSELQSRFDLVCSLLLEKKNS